MAIDNTPPRLKLIITIAAITVITLVSLDFVFRSYYGFMTDEAQRTKLAPPRDLAAHHAQEEVALKSASMPLEQAAAQLVKGSRSDIIAPKPSDDMGPLTGWSKLPKPAPTPEAMPAPAPTAHEPALTGDAGAPGDAGAAPRATKDAGAPPRKGAPHK
jgi:hypothetical protein